MALYLIMIVDNVISTKLNTNSSMTNNIENTYCIVNIINSSLIMLIIFKQYIKYILQVQNMNVNKLY